MDQRESDAVMIKSMEDLQESAAISQSLGRSCVRLMVIDRLKQHSPQASPMENLPEKLVFQSPIRVPDLEAERGKECEGKQEHEG